MEKPEKWRRIRSKPVANCGIFSVREDLSVNSEDRRKGSFFIIECADWVNVIPMTNEGEVILIEQYRHGLQENTLEIPGGMIDRDETPAEAAKRELVEETGYVADNILGIGKSRPNPAIQNNWMHHFVATDCKLLGKTNFDTHESIVTHLVPNREIPDLTKSGKIAHSLVIAAFYLAGDLGKL